MLISKIITNTPYPQVPHPWTQPTPDGKYQEKEITMFQKVKLEFAIYQQIFTQYLHCNYNIYIAFTLYQLT